MTPKKKRLPSSFRDPSGYLFSYKGVLYRQVNNVYKENYNHLIKSGLYDELVKKGLLIKHQETNNQRFDLSKDVYKVIKPERISFVSYPYEWCFSQLKDAALATLEIQKKSIEFGMTLKDASAYNIQFSKGRPVLIDTLSFDRYKEGDPWIAYRQFCQHFLAPLALMAYSDIRLNQLLRVHIDGVPLDLASKLLPKSTWMRFSLISHIHVHARNQLNYGKKKVVGKKGKIKKSGMLAIIDSLESAVRTLTWKSKSTEWGDYYEDTNYSKFSFNQKKKLVSDFIGKVKPQKVWDLGANTGVFSRLTSLKDAYTISFDLDPAAVEKNYLESKRRKEKHLFPLVLDLNNPSPAIGWENLERQSLIQRGPVDLILALALTHHLTISNNVSFEMLARFFRDLSTSLIIEFIPKTDSQVRRLLTNREDIFADYNVKIFEKSFSNYFKIKSSKKIKGSKRTLYLMTSK